MSGGTVLLTLGRLPKALDLARGFAAQGWRVVIAEPFARHLAGASRAVARSHRVIAPTIDARGYLDALRAVIAAERIDLVVPVSEETLHVVGLQDGPPLGARLFAMPAPTLRRMHDKLAFAQQAHALGLDAPDSCRADSDAARALVATGPIVLKPAHGCAGRGLQILPMGAALPASDPAAGPVVAQRFVPGQEFSTCSIVHAGRVSGTIVYRALRKSGSVAIAFARVAQPAIEDWVARFAAATRWTGFLAFDFIVDRDDRPWAIECNPRTTSGLHFWQAPDIAAAILDPDIAPRPRGETQLQLAYSTLTEAYRALFAGTSPVDDLRALFGLRDATWSARDPWPFLSMTVTSWPIIRRAMREGAPFGQVATADVDWRPPDATQDASLRESDRA